MSRDAILSMADRFPYSSLSLTQEPTGFSVNGGVVEMEDRIIIQLSSKRVVVVDIQSRQLLRVNEDDLSGVLHDQILNISDEGDRWEGDVMRNRRGVNGFTTLPYGWGIQYGEDNNREYEGFRIGGQNVCYGRLYYRDLDFIQYEGEWCDGMRWGKGIFYDRNGKKVYEGEWINDEKTSRAVHISLENLVPVQFHNNIEKLTIGKDCCNDRNWVALDLHEVRLLQTLVIGNNCFNHVSEVKVIGLKHLITVHIGENCFTERPNSVGEDPNHHFFLKDCPSITELVIGRFSFSDYTLCEIERVDALTTIQMGDLEEESTWCRSFCHSSFALKGETPPRD